MAIERSVALRRGQALMELAVGMLALALVVSALCGFAVYIVKSLEAQNSLRSSTAGGTAHESVEVGDYAAKYLFGTTELKINEKAVMPPRTIAK